jgi:uncharacterized membrane protein
MGEARSDSEVLQGEVRLSEKMTQEELRLLEDASKHPHQHGDALLEALKLLDHLEDQKAKLEAREKLEQSSRWSELLADKIASFGGSWTFIILFIGFLVAWMIVNVLFLLNPWDPYPFILLNLCLSSVAALQAPVILMSQNRQANRDRARDEIDFERDRLDLKVDTLAAKTIHEATMRITSIEKDIGDIKAMLVKRTANPGPSSRVVRKKKR